ncbi:toprim domain-containing protein [Pelagibacterium lacus]|uniref:Toprim domain-containing protein n=1 Tax=Pelagibacterium lacus TaxID=2282655 RepID=A0A369W1F3_9HYPH|nr:toprim domain-containing protein [Pelagibacterium lacus]RDE08368.1 hypothetical protein DVH29_11595 [Pelagibacterium lacus]
MTLEEAIVEACSSVGVVPPKGRITMRRWVQADTTAKNGKGDGRLICDEDRVTCVNWQTGDKATVWVKSEFTPAEKKRFAERRARDRRDDRERAARAASIAALIIRAAKFDTHGYLAAKGFPSGKALVASAEIIGALGGEYLVPAGGRSAIVVPAQIGKRISSVQLIWEDGTKKFLFGGEMSGAFHTVASGRVTWICEGYATALTVCAALRGLNRHDAVLVGFSASNIVKVARAISGRCFIAADHDAPPKVKPEQFGGLGAGEYFARQAERPYTIPPEMGDDFNDMHQSEGIFAVQRVLSKLIREARP